MEKKIKYILSYLLCIISIYAKAEHKIIGRILDAESNTPIAFCHVKISAKNINKSIIADENGIFEFDFNQTTTVAKISLTHLGYIPLEKVLSVHADTSFTFFLIPHINTIKEVDIISDKKRNEGGNIHYFSPKDAKLNVTVVGELDILKNLQVLPGVSQGMEGTLGLFVRGGNNGGNRVELDGVPLYSSSHLFGLFSIFQTDAIEEVVFKTGGISASNGNFLSSITQITSKNSLNSKPAFNFSVSPFVIGGYAQFPIKKEKLGVIIGGRYSLLRQEYKWLKNTMGSEGDLNPQIMDGFIKFNWQLNNANKFDIEAFVTNDYFRYFNESEIEQNWSNTIFKIAWQHQFNSRNSLEIASYYNNNINAQKQKTYSDNMQLENGLMLSSGINEVSIKTGYNYTSSKLALSVGIELQNTEFNPSSEKLIVASDNTESYDQKLQSLYISPFLSLKYAVNEKLSLKGGVKYYLFTTNNFNHQSADIRLLGNYYINQKTGIEISYDQFSQFYHVLEGLPTGWALDITIPSSQLFAPAKTHQYYSGFYLIYKKIRFNLGAYYKQMDNLVSYKNTQNIFGVTDASWQDEIEAGAGQAYGIEFQARQKVKRLNWSLTYTLSETTRKYPTINHGEKFPFKFDRKHILNLQTDFEVVLKQNKTQNVFATLAYSSGHNITLMVGKYLGQTPPYWGQREGGVFIPAAMNDQAYNRQLMSSKNGFTLPNYFRIDIGYSFKRKRKRYDRDFTLTVFNITNRKNPYLYYYKNNNWYQLSISPIIPSFRWSISF